MQHALSLYYLYENAQRQVLTIVFMQVPKMLFFQYQRYSKKRRKCRYFCIMFKIGMGGKNEIIN